MNTSTNVREGLAIQALSARARRVLLRLQAASIDRLAKLTERQVRSAKACGSKTVEELRNLLAQFGLQFADRPDASFQHLSSPQYPEPMAASLGILDGLTASLSTLSALEPKS